MHDILAKITSLIPRGGIPTQQQVGTKLSLLVRTLFELNKFKSTVFPEINKADV